MSKRAIVIPLIVLVVAALLFLAIFGRWTSWFGDRAERDRRRLCPGGHDPVDTRISGTVRKMEVNDFDSVKAGQVLVEIDDEDYRSIVAEAKAALAASQAALEDNQASKKIQEAKGDNVTQAMLTQRFTSFRSCGNLPGALCHRPVVVCRRLPRRTLCANVGGGRLLRRALWRVAEPLSAHAGYHPLRLCCCRHGHPIYCLCTRATHWRCAGNGDDGTRRSHASPPFGFVDGDVDHHGGGQRADL